MTIKVFRYDLAFGDEIHLPKSIFDKLELWNFKNSLYTLLPYIELTFDEYELIKDKITMNIQIKISDYYGLPGYYSIMPQAVFDALEMAALNGEEYADVDKALFDKMISDYKIKMERWEKQDS
jgi:hypothetical protein